MVHFYNLEADSENKDLIDNAYTKRWFIGPPGPEGYKRVPNQDVFLFRLGYFDHMKLNIEPMIVQSEANKWYSIDLIIDWSEQRVSIYID